MADFTTPLRASLEESRQLILELARRDPRCKDLDKLGPKEHGGHLYVWGCYWLDRFVVSIEQRTRGEQKFDVTSLDPETKKEVSRLFAFKCEDKDSPRISMASLHGLSYFPSGHHELIKFKKMIEEFHEDLMVATPWLILDRLSVL
jgi:hypothetical protein